MNTASLANKTRSGSVSSACDQSTEARNVCWRRTAARAPPVSSRKRSCRLSRISVSDKTRTRAAASSIASGTPPRRRQISAAVAVFSSVRRKSGRTRRARSANNSIASSASDSDGTRQLTSPATPIGSRLVATTVTAGQPPCRPTTSEAHASSRCSQLSSTSNIRRSPTNRRSVSIVGLPCWSGRPSARITATGTRSGSVIGARSTNHAPSPNPSAIAAG
jgi:hypothetical protein